MGKVAVVFAGQGAQYPGMGRDLWENSQAAKGIFDMADSIFPGTSDRCFFGDEKTLSETLYTQTSVMAVNLSCAAALKETGVCADGAAGFSLGELSALPFVKMLAEDEAFTLTVKRAKLMQDAAAGKNGAMAAVLRLDAKKVEILCKEFSNLYPANYNSSGQTVVSGDKKELLVFAKLAEDAGGKSVILAVNGAFHSPYMENAAESFRKIIQNTVFSAPQIPLYSNVTAAPYTVENAVNLMASQIKSPVLWEKTVRNMSKDGYDIFLELGPGKVLSGLIKKILPHALVLNANDIRGIEQAAKMIIGGNVC